MINNTKTENDFSDVSIGKQLPITPKLGEYEFLTSMIEV